ncbi:MAG: clan AA aspartic protease [Gomphosphaeria aponina SAG 52.96 = DSM 107014]|uniref:Clan AA aspartic protease n=1 Tax=Gomphosphaeria aponina SAG 52.96 = DSM 107014 TaxID=1521640 RepID=A0A941JV82_9CHRO|nr:clan AA aspartic protease [Gomphosphaeria aponina SAG 52.96 = DSM 107014]
MILGKVNSNREAIISLAVIGENYQQQKIKAIIDTGYTGFLTLPSTVIIALGLTWYNRQESLLGDGSLCMFDVYEASIIWDSQVRTIEVDQADTDPLIGMGLLEGYELKIQGIEGGIVTITALS